MNTKLKLGRPVMQLPAPLILKLKKMRLPRPEKMAATRMFIQRTNGQLSLHVGDFDYLDEEI